MKTTTTLLLLLLLTMEAAAIPAKRGVKKTLPLNGVAVEAQLMGDEHLHYWQTADGRQLTEQDGQFVEADMAELRHNAMARLQRSAARRQSLSRRKGIGDFTHYTGTKKGLIILVEFSNMAFQAANDSLRYTRICNEEGYNEGSFRGSVSDYFKAQSYGTFNLTFDVVGPVAMPQPYSYYGQDFGGRGEDRRPGEMVATACTAIDSLVDFHDYDWDGDGEVDQVMCIYAGQGQANGGEASTIWPHEWALEESDYGHVLELDSVRINTYAVANERSYNSIEGIGTICHEFSHCLGLADMYDINYDGNFGMGVWSLMDQGSYNGDGFCPAGYSSFDKYNCGWVTPVELTKDRQVTAMQPLEDKPETYMVRNDAYPDEYYLLENRQRKGWDAELPGEGMLILYVDYDHNIWEYNLVNTNNNDTSEGYPRNDHQRCTIFHANNSTSSYSQAGSTYPYQGNDSLTNTSVPAAKLYHENLDGSKLMNKGILNITRNDDGTMAFRFRNAADEVVVPDGTLFYDTFNGCNGRGGNDGQWNTSIAGSNFVPDAEGWECTKPYGGWKCARFGNGSTAGSATTPYFDMPTGEALLSFKAAGWEGDGTTLTISVEDGVAKPSEVYMDVFSWNDYTVRLVGKGPMRVTFKPEHRFLLDDVLVQQVAADSTDVINTVPDLRPLSAGYYSLDGRYLGTKAEALPHGIYLQVGTEARRSRKIVK